MERSQPCEYDILCGRTKKCYENEGNRKYRLIITAHFPKYNSQTMRRCDKTIMVREIVNRLYDEGTYFFRQVGKDQWHRLDKKQARLVVGHALRDEALKMTKFVATLEHRLAKKSRGLEMIWSF